MDDTYTGHGPEDEDGADHRQFLSATPPTIDKLRKDARNAATSNLGVGEVRFLVDTYYQRQEARKRSGNQLRSLVAANEPNELLGWLANTEHNMEGYLKVCLDEFSLSTPLGIWFRSVIGIGPVIAAGMMAHIDVSDPDTTMGQKWAFAGLNPNMEWGKGQKRPYNAALKTLCWKMGESFVKTKGHKDSFYGPYYDKRKAYEQKRNDSGALAEQAASILKNRNIKSAEMKKTLEAGKLVPAHIDARARRWVVKLALGHFVTVAYRMHHGAEMRMPYPVTVLNHDGYIPPPNNPF